MDKTPDPVMNRGIVKGFSARKEKSQERTAQLGERPMDDLFKSEKKVPAPGLDKADVDIDLEDGLDKDVEPDKHMSFEELKSAIENFEGMPEELEELCDLCQDKLMGTKSDGLDTEMDRDEAGMRDEMKKDMPLGAGGMEGAMPPSPPAAAAPSVMR